MRSIHERLIFCINRLWYELSDGLAPGSDDRHFKSSIGRLEIILSPRQWFRFRRVLRFPASYVQIIMSSLRNACNGGSTNELKWRHCFSSSCENSSFPYQCQVKCIRISVIAALSEEGSVLILFKWKTFSWSNKTILPVRTVRKIAL